MSEPELTDNSVGWKTSEGYIPVGVATLPSGRSCRTLLLSDITRLQQNSMDLKANQYLVSPEYAEQRKLNRDQQLALVNLRSMDDTDALMTAGCDESYDNAAFPVLMHTFGAKTDNEDRVRPSNYASDKLQITLLVDGHGLDKSAGPQAPVFYKELFNDFLHARLVDRFQEDATLRTDPDRVMMEVSQALYDFDEIACDQEFTDGCCVAAVVMDHDTKKLYGTTLGDAEIRIVNKNATTGKLSCETLLEPHTAYNQAELIRQVNQFGIESLDNVGIDTRVQGIQCFRVGGDAHHKKDLKVMTSIPDTAWIEMDDTFKGSVLGCDGAWENGMDDRLSEALEMILTGQEHPGHALARISMADTDTKRADYLRACDTHRRTRSIRDDNTLAIVLALSDEDTNRWWRGKGNDVKLSSFLPDDYDREARSAPPEPPLSAKDANVLAYIFSKQSTMMAALQTLAPVYEAMISQQRTASASTETTVAPGDLTMTGGPGYDGTDNHSHFSQPTMSMVSVA